MKTFFESWLVVAIVTASLYLMFSFFAGDLDASHWDQNRVMFFVLLESVCSIVALIIREENI